MCTCGADDGNNNGNNGNTSNNGNLVLDFDNRYKEWKEMMVASIAARDETEHEKQVCEGLKIHFNVQRRVGKKWNLVKSIVLPPYST